MEFYLVKYRGEFCALFKEEVSAQAYIVQQIDCLKHDFSISKITDVNEVIESANIEDIRRKNSELIVQIFEHLNKVNSQLELKKALSNYNTELQNMLDTL
jgi:hypothetical protein